MRCLTAVLMRLGIAAPLAAQVAATDSVPPPGRLVDIGGRRLHLSCTGTGTPTVILLAGGGAYSIDWALVQPPLAKTTRVCAYDRAGLAWSDPGPAQETVEETIDDLHRTLRAAGERGPFVLVGASVAGIYIRAYQRAFPDDVAGLVFPNSSHRIGFVVRGKPDLIWKLSEDDLRSAFQQPAMAKGPRPTREGEPFDRLPPELQRVRLWLDVREWTRRDPGKSGPEAILSWRKEFLREFEEQERSTPEHRPLGNLPVVVVSSDSLEVAPDSSRSEMRGLTLLSSNSAHVTALGSGHEIHLFQPDAVIRAVSRVVTAVRERVPLARVP